MQQFAGIGVAGALVPLIAGRNSPSAAAAAAAAHESPGAAAAPSQQYEAPPLSATTVAAAAEPCQQLGLSPSVAPAPAAAPGHDDDVPTDGAALALPADADGVGGAADHAAPARTPQPTSAVDGPTKQHFSGAACEWGHFLRGAVVLVDELVRSDPCHSAFARDPFISSTSHEARYRVVVGFLRLHCATPAAHAPLRQTANIAPTLPCAAVQHQHPSAARHGCRGKPAIAGAAGGCQVSRHACALLCSSAVRPSITSLWPSAAVALADSPATLCASMLCGRKQGCWNSEDQGVLWFWRPAACWRSQLQVLMPPPAGSLTSIRRWLSCFQTMPWSCTSLLVCFCRSGSLPVDMRIRPAPLNPGAWCAAGLLR